MSHDSPEPTNCRGIINPNYPGFQHLAHTLSEHFFEHQFEHSSEDSDLSEFETEPSPRTVVDTLTSDELHSPPPQHQHIIDLNNKNNNNNNNNTDSLDKIEEILRGAFNSQSFMLSPPPNNLTDHAISPPETSYNDAVDDRSTFYTNDNKRIDDDDDLETYLSRYESPVELQTVLEPLISDALPAPDILMKSSQSMEGITAGGDCSPSDRTPDILQNVVDVVEQEMSVGTAEWDCGSVTMTPVVDIVGNFELEIEHEIGLIVSGYKSSSSDSSLDELSGSEVVAATQAVDDSVDATAEKVEQSLEKVS